MNKQQLIQSNPDMIVVDMDGEKVMMSIESGDYFGINTVGSYIWDMIQDPKSLTQIYDGVKETFDITSSTETKRDIEDFLEKLSQQQLIISKGNA